MDPMEEKPGLDITRTSRTWMEPHQRLYIQPTECKEQEEQAPGSSWNQLKTPTAEDHMGLLYCCVFNIIITIHSSISSCLDTQSLYS